MAEVIAPQSSLKSLIAKGKEQGYLTYSEVNDHLPDTISDPDQVEDIIQMINDMGIKVFETAPDADSLILNEDDSDNGADEVAAAEAAAALAAVENEAGRTTDPVRMYMREMGTVELLTREGEIVIAKRIEEGLRELMKAMALFPGTVEHVLNEYALIDTDERRLSDLITGYLDNTDDIPPPAMSGAAAQNSSGDDSDDSDMGSHQSQMASILERPDEEDESNELMNSAKSGKFSEDHVKLAQGDSFSVQFMQMLRGDGAVGPEMSFHDHIQRLVEILQRPAVFITLILITILMLLSLEYGSMQR